MNTTEPDDNQGEQLHRYTESLPVGPRPARDRDIRRQRLLPSLQAHAEREYRRVRRRRTLLRAASITVAGGATVAAALWIGLPSRLSGPTGASGGRGTPVALSESSAVTVLDGALLLESQGDGVVDRTLHTGDSVSLSEVRALEASADVAARVRLSDTVAAALAPGSRVRPIAIGGGRSRGVPQSLERIALERGRVHVQVKKLGDARRFHVVTPDADVEVRGTTFDVVLRAGGGAPRTCVSVDEGLVMVSSGLQSRLVSRGESWGCDGVRAQAPAAETTTKELTPPAEAATDSTPQVLAKRRSRPARSVAQRPPHAGRFEASDAGNASDVSLVSDLGAQNRLFQTALADERAGRFDAAARTYRRLLARAPHGPLAAQARANLAVVSSPRR